LFKLIPKIMKLILFFSLIFVILFTSCGKYEEGPNFSLRTKKTD
jgi:hypothetical protein